MPILLFWIPTYAMLWQKWLKNKVRLISLGQSVDHAVLPNHIYVPFIDNLAEAIQKAFTNSVTPTLHL